MPHLRDIPLAYLEIVMVGTRFPENVGMAVRACANMGCGGVILAAPERWDVEKARPLATAKGMQRLEAVRVVDSLSAAVRDKVRVYGTTARTGGWRQSVLTPEQAAEELAPLLLEDCPTALVFGPEDRGLNNAEIESCQRLVTIPTRRLLAQCRSGRPAAGVRMPKGRSSGDERSIWSPGGRSR